MLFIQRINLKSILLMAGCFLFALSGKTQNADIDLLDKINPQNPNAGIWINTSKSVYPITAGVPVGLLAAGFISHDKKLQKQGWEALGTIVINTIATQGLKYTINRQRPFEKYNFIYPYDATETGKSFPSGHTSMAFATATTLSLQYKKWYVVVPAYAWAAGVGYSRMYMGEHYPTDVLAGAVIGAGSAFISHWATQKLLHKK
ncbi:phosphatase PAP2 family protein [Limnovirga soli]|uniref:Phosphatase PAP2 family protein n=1 Tax=Limnovirga soli TaxID=2656915 RepID=A0A8J8FEB8_9BACT|nr:phosphatase PAP2 family protein [Limnovirga soli]NNV54824.1 phosphatase PAP2 family protein [Limnovirga soli]